MPHSDLLPFTFYLLLARRAIRAVNTDDFSRTDLLDSLGPFLSGPGLIVCALLWLATVKLRGRFPKATVALSIFGFLLASSACWLAFQFLGAFFALATSWSLITIALLGGAAAEAIVWIYGFEKSLVTPRKGRFLLGLRLASLVVLLLILVQPAAERIAQGGGDPESRHHHQREHGKERRLAEVGLPRHAWHETILQADQNNRADGQDRTEGHSHVTHRVAHSLPLHVPAGALSNPTWRG